MNYKLSKSDREKARSISDLMSIMTPNYRQLGKDRSVKPAPNRVYGPLEAHAINEDHYYEFIPNRSGEVAEALIILKRMLQPKQGESWHRPKFLDVGSGIGNIISLAYALGFYSRGIEYEKSYKDRASMAVNDVTDYMDAFDYKHYNNYDVIYFYQPIMSGELMNKLLDVINSQIKPGTIIMAYDADHITRKYVRELWKPLVNTKKNPYLYEKLFIKK